MTTGRINQVAYWGASGVQGLLARLVWCHSCEIDLWPYSAALTHSPPTFSGLRRVLWAFMSEAHPLPVKALDLFYKPSLQSPKASSWTECSKRWFLTWHSHQMIPHMTLTSHSSSLLTHTFPPSTLILPVRKLVSQEESPPKSHSRSPGFESHITVPTVNCRQWPFLAHDSHPSCRHLLLWRTNPFQASCPLLATLLRLAGC